jgi:hypothetical protein
VPQVAVPQVAVPGLVQASVLVLVTVAGLLATLTALLPKAPAARLPVLRPAVGLPAPGLAL